MDSLSINLGKIKKIMLLARDQGYGSGADGSELHDLSGGPLLETLACLQSPTHESFNMVSGPGGIETLEQRRAGESPRFAKCDGHCGGILVGLQVAPTQSKLSYLGRANGG